MIDRSQLDAVVSALGDGADEETVLAALTQEMQRQSQQGWLDEKVPALGGLTPRQAAADPTRRPDLERLLNEFEAKDRAASQALPDGMTPFSYDVKALREELGLS